MVTAALFDDLANPHLSMGEVAARHGLSLQGLSALLASDQARATLDSILSAAAARTRLIAQLHLPFAAAALAAILKAHPGAACTTAPRDQPRTLSHQAELRRAANTLLRFAAFNHRALARAHEPQRASTPRAPRAAPRQTPAPRTEPQATPARRDSHASANTHHVDTIGTPTTPGASTTSPNLRRSAPARPLVVASFPPAGRRGAAVDAAPRHAWNGAHVLNPAPGGHLCPSAHRFHHTPARQTRTRVHSATAGVPP